MNQKNKPSNSSDTLKGMGGKEMSRQEVEMYFNNGNFQKFQEMGIENRKVVEDFLNGKSAKSKSFPKKEAGESQESGAHLGSGKAAKGVQSRTKGRLDAWFESLATRSGLQASQIKTAVTIVSSFAVLVGGAVLTVIQTDFGQSLFTSQPVSQKKVKKSDNASQEEANRQSKGIIVGAETNAISEEKDTISEQSPDVVAPERPKNEKIVNPPSGVAFIGKSAYITEGFEEEAFKKGLAKWSEKDAKKPINPGLSQPIR